MHTTEHNNHTVKYFLSTTHFVRSNHVLCQRMSCENASSNKSQIFFCRTFWSIITTTDYRKTLQEAASASWLSDVVWKKFQENKWTILARRFVIHWTTWKLDALTFVKWKWFDRFYAQPVSNAIALEFRLSKSASTTICTLKIWIKVVQVLIAWLVDKSTRRSSLTYQLCNTRFHPSYLPQGNQRRVNQQKDPGCLEEVLDISI